MRVYWDKYNGTKPFIQCFRCQAHGYTFKNCNKEYRCVKCAGSHNSKECRKIPDTPAKWVNCKGDHTASYSKCLVLLKYFDKRTTSKIQTEPVDKQHIILSIPSNPILMKPSKYYAQAFKESKPQPTSHSFSPSNPVKPSSEFRSVFQTVAGLTKEKKTTMWLEYDDPGI